ncbi:uncharacterized protein LY89DRAFT_734507 [Mollisia scopiformis]|uniref:Azaphilone pigments biosynthesis cluster protein L N-terminal domain-containing protein n=1 Tax=Mollisia scopiformis TaxID=149040 RepID=A0A194X9F7_MOLSC|nr:uncharacterized protein LY89DRAFT_734507 [Mollisia scopiformis]KUJ16412.1 hypothetical protein LY89DRAFT_734507 [Mollisia scopiformis]
MPEPVITLISGLATIVTNVWKVSKDLHDLIEGIRNAPQHVRVIMDDVHGLTIVLGALQGLLPNVDASRFPTDLVPIFESLQLNLDNCFSILMELSRKLIRYTNAAGEISKSRWMAFRWQFTEKGVNEFRSHLAAYKMTVQLAISTANFANTTQNIDINARIETEMKEMRVQVNEMSFNQDLLDISDAGDHGSVITQDTDRGFALRRFLMTTESVFSDSPPGSPGSTNDTKQSVSSQSTTLEGQPLETNRDLESSYKRRNDDFGNVSSTNSGVWKTGPNMPERIGLGRIKASSGWSYQTSLSQDNARRNPLESQHAQSRPDPTYQSQTSVEPRFVDSAFPMSSKFTNRGPDSLNCLPQQQTGRYGRGTSDLGRASPAPYGEYSNEPVATEHSPERLLEETSSLQHPSESCLGLTKPIPLSNEHVGIDDYEPGSSRGSPEQVLEVPQAACLGVPEELSNPSDSSKLVTKFSRRDQLGLYRRIEDCMTALYRSHLGKEGEATFTYEYDNNDAESDMSSSGRPQYSAQSSRNSETPRELRPIHATLSPAKESDPASISSYDESPAGNSKDHHSSIEEDLSLTAKSNVPNLNVEEDRIQHHDNLTLLSHRRLPGREPFNLSCWLRF